MAEEYTTPDLVELTRRRLEAFANGNLHAARVAMRTTAYCDIDEARAAAGRLAEERE